MSRFLPLLTAISALLIPAPVYADPSPLIPPDTIQPSAQMGYLEGTPSVSPSGEFVWSLPIQAPAGRLGLQPSLSIQYNSRGVNGWLGVGFSLVGYSEIQRCGQSHAIDQKTRGVDFSDKDRFCIDGQRLIAVQGSYGADLSEYRAERGGFDKIIYHRPDEDQPSSFEIYTQDGRILTYEAIRNQKAVAADLAPFELTPTDFVDALWVLREVKDRHENSLLYNTVVVPPPEGKEYILEYLLDSITYHDPQNPKRKIQFIYEDRPDPSFSFLNGVQLQSMKRLSSVELYAPNPSDTQKVGEYRFDYIQSPATHRSLLQRIHQCDGEGVCLWPKEFSYQSDLRPDFEVTELPEADFPPEHFEQHWDTGFLVFDADGDGRDDLLYRMGGAYGFRKTGVNTEPLSERIALDPISTADSNGNGFHDVLVFQTRPVDLSGDGAMEVAAAQIQPDTGYRLFHWDKIAHTLKSSDLLFPTLMITNDSTPRMEAMHFGDADGNGAPDMFFAQVIPQTGEVFWDIVLNDGLGNFDTPMFPPFHAFCAHRARFIDQNGDGRVEMWGTSNAFCTAPSLVSLDDQNDPIETKPSSFPNETTKTLWADLNADGLRDMVHLGSPGWVRFNIGNDHGPKRTLINGPLEDGNVLPGMDPGTYATDLNGDGLEDLFLFRYDPSPRMQAFLSLGDGSFEDVQINAWPGEFHASEGFSTSRVGDFNGDGLLDAVVVAGVVKTEDVRVNGHLRVYTQKPGAVDVMIGIGDGGISNKLREKIVHGDHREDDGYLHTCTFPQQCIKRGIQVVKEHRVWQGERIGEYNTKSYRYEDPRSDVQGRGFLGFGKVIERDLVRLSETITEYDHETRIDGRYPFAGVPKVVTQVIPLYEGDSPSLPAQMRARVIKTENQYEYRLLNGGKSYWSPKTAWTESMFEGDYWVKPDRNESLTTNIVPLRFREGHLDYDAYGNAKLIETQTLGGVYDRTVNTYEIREQDWLIHLLKTTEIRSAAPPFAFLFPKSRTASFDYDAQGEIQKIYIEPYAADPNVQKTTTVIRDADGLITQLSEEAPGVAPGNTYIAYEDHERIFPQAVWNDLGFTDTYAIHPAFGLLAVVVDMHGIESRYWYDGFGRLLRAERDGDGGVSYGLGVDTIQGNVTGLISAVYGGGGDAQSVITDVLGRPVVQYTKSFDGQWSMIETSYDRLGRPIQKTRPGLGAPSNFLYQTVYDSLDRITKRTAPDGSKTKYHHEAQSVETEDPDGRVSRQTWDVDGRIVESAELLGNQWLKTSFLYTNFNQVQQVTDPEGNVSWMQYDRRGRRISLNDPDHGLHSFLYDGLDELVSEKNALNEVTTYAYDTLGRRISRTDVDGVTQYVWDTQLPGTLSAALSPDGISTNFGYDGHARINHAHWTVNGKDFGIDLDRDIQGRVRQVDYPGVDGRARFGVQYVYNAWNHLEQVRDAQTLEPYWTVKAREADGQLAEAELGDALKQVRTYDPKTGRLLTMQTLKGLGAVDGLEYLYDFGGNVVSRTDSITGRAEKFSYDDVNRLTSWKLMNNGPVRQTQYAYSPGGNLLTVTVNQQEVEQNSYGGAHPHALKATLKGSYSYDAAGRMVQGGGRGIWYTAFNLPKSIEQNGLTFEFGYDAFGERVIKSSDSGTVLRIAEMYERRAFGTSVEHIFFVPGTEGTIAEVHYNETAQTEDVRYLHGDALGSVHRVTLKEGKELEAVYFEPFGKRIDADGYEVGAGYVSEASTGFTGHFHDDELGLISMRGRMYDPGLRRFVTPDPVLSSPLLTQSYDRYGYVRNNPLRYTDPSGFYIEDGHDRPNIDEAPQGPVVGYAPPALKMVRHSAGTPRKGASHPQAQRSDASGYKGADVLDLPMLPVSDRGPDVDISMDMAYAPSGTDALQLMYPVEESISVGPPPPPGGGGWNSDPQKHHEFGVFYGFGLGFVPGGAVADQSAIELGLLTRGSREAEMGKGAGMMAAGLMQMAGGLTGGGFAGLIGFGSGGVGAGAAVAVGTISWELLANGAVTYGVGFSGMLSAAMSIGGSGGGGPPGSNVSAGPANPVPPAAKPSGQVHHAISKRVHDKLQKHETLKGLYDKRDRRFELKAINKAAHNGWWGWHQNLDAEVVEWLDDHQFATKEQFEAYLHWRYAQPDLAWRFPNGIQSYIK